MTKRNSILRRLPAVVSACLVVLSVLWVKHEISTAETIRHRSAIRTIATRDLARIRGVAESIIARRAYLTSGLRFFVQTRPDLTKEEFAKFSRSLRDSTPGIRSVTLIRDNVITDVFPLKGNEKAIGLQLLSDPVQQRAAQKAIESERGWFDGPIELVQGGKAFVNREPVFTESPDSDDGGREYWGLVSLLIDRDVICEEILESVPPDFQIAIRANDSGTGEDIVFLGDQDAFDGEPLRTGVVLPSGSWTLYGAPKVGWDAESPYSSSIAWAFNLLALFSGLSSYLLISHQSTQAEKSIRLAEANELALQSRMKEQEAKSQLQDVLQLARIGLWDWDLKSDFVYYSPTYKEQLGHAGDDPWKNDASEWSSRVHPEDFPIAEQRVKECLDDPERFYQVTFRMRTKGNQYKWMMAQGKVQCGADGKPERITGVHVDVTPEKTALAELDQTRLELENIFSAMPTALVFADLERNIVRTNRAFEEMFGYRQDEIEGNSTASLYAAPDDFRAAGQERFRKDAEPNFLPYSINYRRKDGTKFPGETVGTVVPDADGSATGFLGLINDVSRLVEAESERDNFFSLSVDFFCVVNESGHFTRINQAWSKLLGYEPDELLHKPVKEFVHPENRKAVQESFAQLLSGQPLHYLQTRFRAADSSYRWLEWNATAIIDDRVLIYAAARDITDRLEQENERLRLTEELHQKANDLQTQTLQLDETVGMLKRSNEELSKFAYVASHDLRSPLQSVIRLSEWVQEDLDEAGIQLPEKVNEYLFRLQRQVKRMYQLLNGLLEYSRAGRESTIVERIEVEQLLVDVVELVAPPEGFEVRIEGSFPVVTTARSPLQRVFLNLIANAIKHHDRSEGVIAITGSYEDDVLKFELADDGPGIDPEHRERVFEIYQTLKPRDEMETSGMGLSIVKKLVENFGGKVGIEANHPRGTIVCFTWHTNRENDSQHRDHTLDQSAIDSSD